MKSNMSSDYIRFKIVCLKKDTSVSDLPDFFTHARL